MSKIWYLSPSNQATNIGVDGYGSEKEQMNLLVEQIVPHLDRAGVSFHVGDADISIEERVKESNELNARFHLALHSNAGRNGKACGPVAYYYSEAGKAFGEMAVAALLSLGQQSNRAENVKQEKGFYELRKTTAPACLLEVDFHDSPVGVAFLTRRRSEIAEAIARVIIEADGKQFVPRTEGECLELCRKWGLFDSYDRDKPLSKKEAAIALVRLKELIQREVNS